MHKIALALACMSCVSHGRRVKTLLMQEQDTFKSVDKPSLQRTSAEENQSAKPSFKVLAASLLALNPAEAFTAGVGYSPAPGRVHGRPLASFPSNAVLARSPRLLSTQNRTGRHTPIMSMDNEMTPSTAEGTFNATKALSMLKAAATRRDIDPDILVDALLGLEKRQRALARDDGGVSSRATLAALDGCWRLVFTTGTIDMQQKIGRKINYFPIKAVQTFRTADMTLTNGIYLGDFAVLKFFGPFSWDEAKRKLEFDFDSIAVLGARVNLPKGGAAKIGSSTGLGSENNEQLVEKGKKPFFNWISADEDIATARGGGGGLALWRRDREMEAMRDL